MHDGDTIYSQTGGGNDWSQVICPAILGRGTGTTDSQKRIGTPLLHRYDIQLFLNIKELKKRGLQLRAIKNLIPQITASMTGFGESASTLLEGEVIDHAEVKTDRDLKEKISQKDEGKNDKILEFQAILERLITQELKAQNEDEERCRSLDYAIRRQQLARKEAAAAAEKKSGRRHRDK